MDQGDVIDEQFEVIEQLGNGGFGQVYLVKNLADDRKYALKRFTGDPGLDGIKREFGPLRRLDHNNIVKAHWAGRTRDGSWYLATDFVPGESLADRLETVEQLPVAEIIRVGDQLLDALRAMHPDEDRLAELSAKKDLTQEQWDERAELSSSGIVHRDIKPENIIVRPDGELVVVDFGIASRVGTQRRTVSFTRGYLPPDITSFDSGFWEADVDRYAAGKVLLDCACGREYESADGLPDIRAIRPALPASFAGFLTRACAPTRQNRFATTAEMVTEWLAVRVPLEGVVEQKTNLPIPESGSAPVMKYQPWPVTQYPPANLLNDREVTDLLLEIVAAEGPLLCRRLYDIFGDATGSRPVSVLNRATYTAVRTGLLKQIERLGGGQQDKTVYFPGTNPGVLRSLGPRVPGEVPTVELDAWASFTDSMWAVLSEHEQAVETAELMLSDLAQPDRGVLDKLAYRLEGIITSRAS